MRSKLLAIVAVLAVISSIYVSSMAVYAGTGGQAVAGAGAMGIGGGGSAMADGNAYARYYVDATGNIYQGSDADLSPFLAVAEGTISVDVSSSANINLVAIVTSSDDASARSRGDAEAEDGGTAYLVLYAVAGEKAVVDLYGYAHADGGLSTAVVDFRGGSAIEIDTTSSGLIQANGEAISSGYHADALTIIGNSNILNHSSGEISYDLSATADGDRAQAESNVGTANITVNSAGTISVTVDSDASGTNALALVTSINISINDSSSGEVELNATASADGTDAHAIITNPQVILHGDCDGEVSLDIAVSAAGDNSQAGVGTAMVVAAGGCSVNAVYDIDACATGESSEAMVRYVYATIYSNDADISADVNVDATDGGHAATSVQMVAQEGDVNYTVYSLASASGDGAVADTSVLIVNGAPEGGYVSVASDGSSTAIVFILAYGNNVIVFTYADANGGTASASATCLPDYVMPDAQVGFPPEII